MERKTVKYKRTLRGSVGAGVGALFNGNGRRYFILEHKDASKYHKAGESQKIIIDQVELGRDGNCQVRFDDETFPTVSRRHAAIIKEGDKWKLVQLSQTNSTFLNGRTITSEWYLENGDEIQLSTDGPRMGFIVPAGKQSLVSSIKMTERLELFRKQALRPYKTAIACLSIILLLSVGGLGTWNYLMKQNFDTQITKAKVALAQLKGKNVELEKLMKESAVEQARLDSLLKAQKRPINKTVIVRSGGEKNEASKLAKFESDIYYMQAMVCAVYNGNIVPLETKNGGYIAWSGTGFLLDDGKFVTAKHCVEGWKFDSEAALDKQYNSLKDELKPIFLAGLTNTDGVRLVAMIVATSPSKPSLKFVSEEFRTSRADEKKVSLGNDFYRIKATGNGGCDWAYVNTGKRGCITADINLSSSLPAGARLEVLGFPQGMKSSGGSCLYGSCQTSGRGLNGGLILISGKNYEHGNSGGPVFYNINGTYKAVGIVSFSVYDNMGGITPLCNLR